MLKIDNIKVVYSGVVLALNEVSMVVPEGNIVALIGSNGSGKSTTLKSISGVLATEDGKVTGMGPKAPPGDQPTQEAMKDSFKNLYPGASDEVAENLAKGR